MYLLPAVVPSTDGRWLLTLSGMCQMAMDLGMAGSFVGAFSLLE